MPSVWLTSDTHFGHVGVTKFMNDDGSKLRPWDDAEKMTWDMVDLWNQTVKPDDKVYHLGDVVMNRKWLFVLNHLHGDKVLIKGNHDIFKLSDYSKYFRDIRAYHVMDKLILSHIPIHEQSLGRFRGNIHGHLHGNHVMKGSKRDARYVNVCVEQTEFKPILFERVNAMFT